ncbi:MAG: bile acid:sodium symporter family protein [Nitrospinae bacterium]|nr:bile acid:sodium symporter family protein [Nitrospinota bacterium]
MRKIEKIFLALAGAFPLWVIGGAALALWEPATATWFRPGWIPLFLGVIMLSMGLTLDFRDFRRVLEAPKSVFLGVGLQYLVMPFLGYAVSKAFNLPMDYVIGLILVGCAPGGTASNVVCFIARANVPLSVTLTACSTLLAVVMTPLLTSLLVQSISRSLLGVALQVNTWGLLVDTFQVVIVPVAAGTVLNHYFHPWVKKIEPYAPLLAVLSIVFIVDYILAAKRQEILSGGGNLIAAVLTLHAMGFLLGYVLARLLFTGERDARTISVEVGMQNSGLATELARSNFPAFALATVPGAVSALTHCVLGSLAAGLCRLYPARDALPERLKLGEQESSG